jgi:hypothetical protein
MITIKKIVALVAMLFALIATPAFAQTDDPDMQTRGFAAPDGTIIVAVDTVFDSDDEAELTLIAIDADLIEDDLGMMVVSEQELTDGSLRGLGADRAMTYGVVDEDAMQPGLLVTAVKDDHLYVFIIIGTIDNVDPFAFFTSDVLENGLDDADEPDGFTEVELDDEDAPLPSSL